MSALDKLMESTLAKETVQSKNIRLVADPNITVDQIQRVFKEYMDYKKSADAWSLIGPPPGGPKDLTWKTPIHAPWLSKVMGLLFALLEVAPNSKLQSIKVLKALQNLYEARDLQLPLVGGHHLTTASDKMDRIDFSVRLLLSHLRLLKINIPMKNKICRMLSQTEVLRLGHTLDKMDLPVGYVEEVPSQADQSTPPLAIMDIEEPTPEPTPDSLPSMPSFPMKKCTTSSFTKAKAAKKSASFSSRFPELPQVFNRILNGGKPGKILDDAMGKPSNILDEAMEFVAPLAKAKVTSPKNMKINKMAVKGNPKPALIKKKAMKAKATHAKKVRKTTATPNGESLSTSPSLVVPTDTNIHVFHSPQYGSCKMEIYSQKSYIRKKDEGKWKSIIGSCSSKHGEVVRALVPYVIQGLNVEELYKVRNSLHL